MTDNRNDLPPSSQLSSVLSDPPASDNEEELGEITVDLNTTTISPQRNSSSKKNCSNMPARKLSSKVQAQEPTRQSLRRTKKSYRTVIELSSGEDELRDEIQVSPPASKTSGPAKRARVDSTTMRSSKPTPKPAAKRTKPTLIRGLRRWEPEFVTQSAKSPLVTGKVDLRVSFLPHLTQVHLTIRLLTNITVAPPSTSRMGRPQRRG